MAIGGNGGWHEIPQIVVEPMTPGETMVNFKWLFSQQGIGPDTVYIAARDLDALRSQIKIIKLPGFLNLLSQIWPRIYNRVFWSK